MTLGSRIAGLAAVIAIVGFFLPCVTVSCGGSEIMTMSGYEVANGGVIQTPYGPSESMPGRPELFVTPAAAILICIVFYVAYVRSRIGLIATAIQSLLAGIGVGQVFLVLEQMRSEYGDPDMLIQASAQTEYGFWITVFGMGGVIVGSLLSVPDLLRQRPRVRREKPPPGYHRAQIKRAWRRTRMPLRRVWRAIRIPLAALVLIAGVLFFLNWNAATSLSPTWSPDGQRLAFVSDHGSGIQWSGSQVFVIEANGADRYKLVDSDNWNIQVAWAPDGKHVAFGSLYESYITDSDGTEVRRISEQGVTGVDFAWSPDGREIAFFGRPTGSDSYDIYALDVEGDTLRSLTRGQKGGPSLAWSPDGQHIAYVCAHEDAEYICMVDVNAGNLGQPVRQTGCGIHNEDPEWSPDGQHIVWGSREGLCIADTESLTPRKVVDYIQWARSPAWSPDGNQIVFLSGGDQQIYVVNKDGGNPRQLLAAARGAYRPAWSPDGKQLALDARLSGNLEIYVMNIDGSNLRRLTHSRYIPWLPAWAWPW